MQRTVYPEIGQKKGGISLAKKENENLEIEQEKPDTENTEPQKTGSEDADPVPEAADAADDAEDYIPESDEFSEFQAIDVSEPRAPVREMDIIEEALAIRRRDWIKTHSSYIFGVIGLIVVGLIVFGIYMYFQNTNPLSQFVGSISKNFSSSFHFDIKVTEDDEAVMSYVGDITLNRGRRDIKALYEADYNRYTYVGAVYSHNKYAVQGSLYDEKWTTHNCSDTAQDFFEFDKAFRAGGFDGGAFLRFTGLTSDCSTRELNVMADLLKKRLSTDSSIATITTEKVENGARYFYEIDLYELFMLIKEDGASVFYRATDYEKFVALFDANKSIIESARCTFSFVVDSGGHMSELNMSIFANGHSYGLSCEMSGFSKTEVNLPKEFLKAAQLDSEE